MQFETFRAPLPSQIERAARSELQIRSLRASCPYASNQSAHLSKLKLKFAGKTIAWAGFDFKETAEKNQAALSLLKVLAVLVEVDSFFSDVVDFSEPGGLSLVEFSFAVEELFSFNG